MILGIDFGGKYIGLALGDKGLKIAFPYQTIENRGFGSVLNQIKAICQKEKIKMIIVGRPMGMAGQKTRQTKLTDQFVAKLKRQINTKIKVEDERLTSQAAERFSAKAENKNLSLLASSSPRRSGRSRTLFPARKKIYSENNHALAAMIILQNYLDKMNNRTAERCGIRG